MSTFSDCFGGLRPAQPETTMLFLILFLLLLFLLLSVFLLPPLLSHLFLLQLQNHTRDRLRQLQGKAAEVKRATKSHSSPPLSPYPLAARSLSSPPLLPSPLLPSPLLSPPTSPVSHTPLPLASSRSEQSRKEFVAGIR